MPDAAFEIEVAFARPERQVVRSLCVPAGTTLREAIQLSGIADEFPDEDLDSLTLGVFGEVRPDDSAVCAGDRVEIYRPLAVDPRAARHARVRGDGT
ncbi:MAG: RnfH family protein [Pseudomonadota bacterium]